MNDALASGATDMIGLARQFEISVKIMSTAKEMDERTTQLMNLG